MGIKVGDRVKVMRKPTMDELGGVYWHPEMDEYVGNRFTVLHCDIDTGFFELSKLHEKTLFNFYFPICVLMNLNRKKKIKRIIDEI